MPQQKRESSSAVRERFVVKEPDIYDVIMLNDDFTTMEFVIEVLHTVFFHSIEKATQMMLAIHQSGQCIVGSYTFDIAQSKVDKATSLARDAGYPLRLKIEKKA